MFQRVWITGAGGLIGGYMVQAAEKAFFGARVHGLTRAEVDLTDFSSVDRMFKAEQPELIVHCAAMSRSPECQQNPEGAHRANVEATRHLALLAERVAFIHFSTDLVFDGRKAWYKETDTVNPLSVYAETKVQAEEIVKRNPAHAIIRTSLNGGKSRTGNRGFNEETVRAWKEGRTLNFFVDEFRCPIAASETARAVCELALRGGKGVYHVAGSERLSRWQIGELLAAKYSCLSPKLQPGSLKDYRGASRAPDVSLDCSKAQELLSFGLPAFTEWFREHSSEWD